MAAASRHGIREGIGLGVIAGILFGGMQVVASVISGNAPLLPFRFFASVVLGSPALYTVAPATAVAVGGLVHLLLSGLFGMLYAVWNAGLSLRTQTHFGREACLGALFGILLWFVNFQIVARVLYPWFLETPQFLEMSMHALLFGLPLGLMYAGYERRVHPVLARAG